VTISMILSEFDKLNELEREVRELHDRVCGPGVALAERSATALAYEVADSIRDTLYRELGEIMITEKRQFLDGISIPEPISGCGVEICP